MKCKKLLTTLVVIALMASTMIVLNKIADFKLAEDAGATQVTPGYNYWMGNYSDTGDGVVDIINKTDGSATDKTSRLYYGNTVDIGFNGSVITQTSYLYYPNYNYQYDQTSGNYEVYVNWSLYSSTGITTTDLTFDDVYLSRAGLWLVIADDAPTLYKVNMSNLSIADPPGGTNWENIIGWFWVNASTDWSVTLSKTSFYYDKNESLTITVRDGSGNPVNEDCFIDIWNVYDIGSSGVGTSRLAYHKELAASANGVWSITGAQMYNIIHYLGAGTYQVSAYAAYEGSTAKHSEAVYFYGSSGGRTYDTYRGWNDTFGNTDWWPGRFIESGTTSQIRSWGGDVVTADSMWVDGSDRATTYRWQTCGPFDPPEYWTGYTNFSVFAGMPNVVFNNESEIFYNETYSTTENQINVTIENYDGDWLDASQFTVTLYNKANNPAKSTASPINSDYYTVSTQGSGQYLIISPNGTGNHWGINGTTWTEWAGKGKVYVQIEWTSVGNASHDWNTTFSFKLISAVNSFKWIHDGSTGTDSVIDGELGRIPSITNVPVDIKFKFISSDYWSWGDGNGGETFMTAAENITISGNSLFTGTLDKYPNFGSPNQAAWYSSGTWTIPIIPTMSIGGGEITITADAWNATISGKLNIGGANYLSNGTVVTVTPNRFDIDEADQTLDISVTTAGGTSMPGATVTLYYIDEDAWDAGVGPMDGANQHVDRETWGLGTNTMEFNITQQTTNQSPARSGLSEKHAPRNLTLYAMSNGIYGYAIIRMDPNSDMELMIGRETMMAGYPYEDFDYSCTLIGTNDTPSSDDKSNFNIQIFDENHDDVTDALFSDSGFVSGDFAGEYSRSTSYFSDIYALTPGTYTFYAYNKTHDSAGNNASLVVEPVDVTVDKTPLVWKSDENISATFSIRYNGAPVNGSLLLDNITDLGEYNETWRNSSFDGSSDQGGNSSLEVDESEIIGGDVTVYDITANVLEAGEAVQNITFWFKPIRDDGVEGAFARANGRLPIEVPAVMPNPQYISLGTTTKVTCTATGRGTPLDDIFVGLNGQGVSVSDTNGTTGTDGTVQFSITPSSTGDIDIHVGEEGRVISTKITVTTWQLSIEVSTSQVLEGDTFSVTVTDHNGDAVEGAKVTVVGYQSATTGSDGKATFTAPTVSSDTTYIIKATKAGYAQDPDTMQIKVVNVPVIYISAPTSITLGKAFKVEVGADNGNNNGISIVIKDTNGNVVATATSVNGIVTITIKNKGTYTIDASKTGYKDADTLTIKITEEGVTPGFELLTLIIALGVAFILLKRRRQR